MIEVSNKLTDYNGKRIRLNASEIRYKDLEDKTRTLISNLIIESGEDEDGRTYIKYADGRQVCTGKVEETGIIDTEWGSMFYLSLGNDEYIKPFIEIPNVLYANQSDAAVLPMPTNNIKTNKTGDVDIYVPRATTTERTYTVGYEAWGRWK